MTSQQLHATCVALDGQGVLVTGASGAGKSGLALQLIALGATLVADDQTLLSCVDDMVWASRPATLPPLIEARGVGLLHAPMTDKAPIKLVVDMDKTEATRLPPDAHVTLLGCRIPLRRRVESLHFAPAILLLLRHGSRSI